MFCVEGKRLVITIQKFIPPNQTKISYQTEFQINAILSRSLQFTKLQNFKFWLEMAGDTEVDQEILNAAGKVIPNIVIG